MTNRFLCCVVALGSSIAAFTLSAQAPAGAPAGPPAAKGKAGGKGKAPGPPAAPTPHLPDGTVDLSGVWTGFGSNAGNIAMGLKAGEQVLPLAWAVEKMKALKSQDDPQA
ncbi:MAG: hypothetical protein ABI995_11220, partial [Acidobacteriota bacterium]